LKGGFVVQQLSHHQVIETSWPLHHLED